MQSLVLHNCACPVLYLGVPYALPSLRKATFTQFDDGCIHTVVESLTPKLCLCYVRFLQLIPTVYDTYVPQRRASSCAVMRGF